MRHIIGIVHQDEDSAFGIQFPDAPGCFSAADDMDELFSNAQQALALWLEDETISSFRGISDLMNDPDVKNDMQEGGTLLAVPLIAMTGRTVKANMTLDAGLLQAIDAAAKARGMTRSAFMADAARREIGG